jgi:hypothetical protein
MRITITAPQFDSLTIIPLSETGQPLAAQKSIGLTRRTGNKFTTVIDTKTMQTPWYKLVFGITTSVREDHSTQGVAVLSQPVSDGLLRMVMPESAYVSRIIDLQGQDVLAAQPHGSTIDVSHLAKGVYSAVVVLADGGTVSRPFVINEK